MDVFFRFREHNLPNLDVQDLLNEVLAEPLLAHDLLKDKVVRDGQIFPDFVHVGHCLLHGHRSFLVQLYADENIADKGFTKEPRMNLHE